jgi:hypothetical protein
MGNLLISLSGARPEILDQCPTERLRFQSLGWALLITSGIAALSMWFALASVLGLNPVLAFVVAIFWGLVILGIDRWLITSMPVGSRRRFTIALPRLLLAVLLGTLISTPIVLRVFQSEINAQITVIKEQRANTFLRQEQHSQVAAQVATWTKNASNLENVINSGGAVSINPANDPQVRSLTAQRTAELKLDQTYFQEWQCQLYGGAGCTVKGNGPLAQASENSYNQAKDQVATLTSQIQQREQQLASSDAQSKAARLQEAKAALPAAQSQLAAATARQQELQASFTAQNAVTNGLLIRLQALDELTSQGGGTLNAARILLFLLFLVIECLPVTVKLLQQPGNYERIMDAARTRELRDAQRAYRSRPRPSALSAPSATLPFADLSGTVPGHRTMLHDIWRAEELPDWDEHGDTHPLAEQPGRGEDSEDHARLDDQALRQMEDTRAGTARPDFTRNGSGIELRYGEDDL